MSLKILLITNYTCISTITKETIQSISTQYQYIIPVSALTLLAEQQEESLVCKKIILHKSEWFTFGAMNSLA